MPLAAGGSEYVTGVGSMTFTVSPGRMMPGRSTQPTSPRFFHAAFTKWLASFSRSGWWAWMTLPGPVHGSFSSFHHQGGVLGEEEARARR